MVWIVGFATLVILYLLMPGHGKFWHRHDWYQEMEMILHSRKKENIYRVYKCSRNCSAFKVTVETIKIDQRV